MIETSQGSSHAGERSGLPTAIETRINGKTVLVKVDPRTPLLWVVREHLGLTGTKYSCGRGLCGACTVLLDDEPVRSCITPARRAVGREVTTIEGIRPEHSPVMAAWIEENVPQCGYCQPGQVLVAIALLRKNPNPSDSEIDQAMKGNLCRCGTYLRIRRAIHRAAQRTSES